MPKRLGHCEISGDRTSLLGRKNIHRQHGVQYEGPACMMPLFVCNVLISQTRLDGMEGMKEAETLILYPISTSQRLFQISR